MPWIRQCDLDADRDEIEHDKFSQWRRDYLKHPHPSHMQYGWVWKDDGGSPTIPIEGRGGQRG